MVVLGGTVVATRRVRTPGEKRAGLARWDWLVELVDEEDLVRGGDRPALGADDDVVEIVKARVVEEALGHAEDLLQGAGEHRLDLARRLLGQTRTADLSTRSEASLLDGFSVS